MHSRPYSGKISPKDYAAPPMPLPTAERETSIAPASERTVGRSDGDGFGQVVLTYQGDQTLPISQPIPIDLGETINLYNIYVALLSSLALYLRCR